MAINGGRFTLIKFFNQLFNEKNDGSSKRTIYLLIIGLIGLLLIIISNIFSTSEQKAENELPLNDMAPDEQSVPISTQTDSTTQLVQELEKSYQNTLEEMLNQIQGVSEAEVMVNLDSTNIQIYEKDLIIGQQTTNESDTNGGTRQVEDHTEETQVVRIRQGDQEVPLLIQTKKPEVRGVFVVANGVDHATIKMWVIEAVSKVLDVPTHKISVLPKN